MIRLIDLESDMPEILSKVCYRDSARRETALLLTLHRKIPNEEDFTVALSWLFIFICRSEFIIKDSQKNEGGGVEWKFPEFGQSWLISPIPF